MTVGLDLPTRVEPSLPGIDLAPETDLARATELLVAGLSVGAGEPMPQVLGDEALRRFVLAQVLRLAPSGHGPVAAVEVSGRLVPSERPYHLAKGARARIRGNLVPASAGEVLTEAGTVREIDLDHRSFKLRERPNGQRELHCRFPIELLEEAKGALGRRVMVTGSMVLNRGTGKGKLLTVHVIEDAEGDE